MKKLNFFSSISTLGFIGYFIGSGTLASIATLPIVYLINYFNISSEHQIIFLIFLIFASIFIIDQSLPYFRNMKDPSEIVIDELIGCLITFWSIEFSLKNVLLGLVLFRLFDIYKPLGLKKLENLSGGLGIVMDDVFAGIISNIILRLINIFL